MPNRVNGINIVVMMAVVLVVFAIISPVAICADSSENQDGSHKVLAEKHKDVGITCKQCHPAGPSEPVAMEQCMECHGSYKELMKKSEGKGLEINPHDAFHMGLGDIRCTLCHKGHKPSVMYCNTCHAPYNTFELEVP